MNWLKFGHDMKKARKEKGLSQNDIANLLGVTTAMVSQIENGKKATSVDNVVKISKVLGINFF